MSAIQEDVFKFVMNRLDKSQVAVKLVSDWLNKNGYHSEIMPFEKAPSYAERMNYVDDGDIKTTAEGNEYRVEVKGVSVPFTSVASYPTYGRSVPSIIVDEAYKANKHHELPLWAYAIVNKQKTGLFWIPKTTAEHWFVEELPDRHVKQNREFMLCPLSKVEYYGL
jgi:hypothetical protein